MRHVVLIAIGLLGCREPAAPPTLVSPSPPAFRLPSGVSPVRYRLALTVVPEAVRASGTLAADLQVSEATSTVWLNAEGLTAGAGAINGQPAAVTSSEHFIGLTSRVPLAQGPATLELFFEAPINHEKSEGLYAEKEGDDTYAYTFFEPIDARRAFPSFDEPWAKVPWTLSLTVKQGQVALANTPVAAVEALDGGLQRVTFEPTPPLPSYLVAFVVGPFELVDGGVAGRAKTPIRFVIPRGRGAELAYAQRSTPKVVTALEDWFDTDFPMKKLDVAVVPRFWGTMEHPGLVAMGQPLTLIRPGEDTRDRRENYTNILAHELSHYWFGDVVTLAWWDDTWLNEALAEYLDPTITDAAEPGWKLGEQRLRTAVTAMNADEQLETKRIRLPVETNEAIQASFDGEVSYSKGASVLRMFEGFVGSEPWRAFFRGYVRRHAWGTITSAQLLSELRERHGDFVADGMLSFLDQPGVPLIEASVSCTGKKSSLTLTQHRALPAGVKAPSPQTWKLPVCLRWGTATNSERTCVELSAPSVSVMLSACPTWVLLNDSATGYYRSAVSADSARALLDSKSPGTRAALTSSERRLLLADLLAANERAELALDEVMKLVTPALKDPDDRVAGAALGTMAALVPGQLPGELALAGQAWNRTLCAPRAAKLGWKRLSEDSDDRHQLRTRLLWCAVSANDPTTLAEGARIATKFLADPASAGVSDDVIDIALCAAARSGTFDALLAAARASVDRTHKARFLGALGCVTSPELSARALALVAGTDADLRDPQGIAVSLLSQPQTRDAAWAWMKANVDGLLERMRSDEASWLMAALGGAWCETNRRAEVEAFLTSRAKGIDGAQAMLARGLGESDRCIARLERERPALERLFTRK